VIKYRNIPLVKLREQLFSLFAEKQDVKVFGHVPDESELPLITFGAVIAKPMDTKQDVFWECSATIDVWGDEDSEDVIAGTLDDISLILSVYGEKLDIGDDFKIQDCSISLIETFPEETTGYHGLMTVDFLIQKKGAYRL